MAEISSNNSADECPPTKKVKIQIENTSKNVNSIHETEFCSSIFNIKRILQNNCMRKQICIEGVFKGFEDSAVIILEKQNFSDDEQSITELFNKDTVFHKLYNNDIYGNYECFPLKKFNGINATIIHPATEKHIEKFQRKELHIIDETYELYQKITLPYIESSSFSVEWIYNILEHKAEQDKIVYEDKDEKTGFVIVNDLKWDGQPNTLKLIALPFQKIRSIRELNAFHLPLLKNIREAGTAAIAKKFNISASQLRIYLHYQPSYYYLHVHFAYLMFETPGIYVEKAHLLSTVIRNIELMSDYYMKAILSYVVAEQDPLYIKFLKEGIINEVKSKNTED
ncbi:m7GpppX diphosphatase [Apis florea]|uniref:m7GpppX diphosphatase n=1 Tax=Apis florea TaxID=7463 RepID=UPI000252B520|nr:m7GpppX diphosphatase [Apis florea]XP_012341515.1 m7GpppX diphosphatase [Apis florea]XP_012341516.1 m7GpppX diphosphatase [Apis florea]XP_012341517.1 m7GpppX diphosphatase [Apis florea]